MINTIISEGSVYNLFCNISDMPRFESGLTREQIEKLYIKENGAKHINNRLTRADKKGTSSKISTSLEDEICIFLENNNISVDSFIEKYLTIQG